MKAQNNTVDSLEMFKQTATAILTERKNLIERITQIDATLKEMGVNGSNSGKKRGRPPMTEAQKAEAAKNKKTKIIKLVPAAAPTSANVAA